MSTSRPAALAASALFLSLESGAESPQLGEPLSASEVAALDYVVLPDGSGLPEGSGTVSEGAALYARHCLVCHGERGENGINDRLAGGHGTLDGDRPVKTVGSFWPYATTLFDYVRRAMPYQEPGTLSNDEVYALSAYLLFINDVLPESARLDAAALAEVEMPNRDNFVWVYQDAAGTDER